MPQLPLRRRLMVSATWPVGVALTSWRYLWRTTPLHRRQTAGSPDEDRPPPLPDGIDRREIQHADSGVGPLFHRRYRTRIRDTSMTPEALMARVKRVPDCVAPNEFARFEKANGGEEMRVGDEWIVRMPSPWDGPVRVTAESPTSFRLVTLAGHLESGQIEFRARRDADGLLVFEIESWGRSADRLVDLLYEKMHMAKETQLHMWTSVLERVCDLSGGRMTGGIDIETRRLEVAG